MADDAAGMGLCGSHLCRNPYAFNVEGDIRTGAIAHKSGGVHITLDRACQVQVLDGGVARHMTEQGDLTQADTTDVDIDRMAVTVKGAGECCVQRRCMLDLDVGIQNGMYRLLAVSCINHFPELRPVAFAADSEKLCCVIMDGITVDDRQFGFVFHACPGVAACDFGADVVGCEDTVVNGYGAV